MRSVFSVLLMFMFLKAYSQIEDVTINLLLINELNENRIDATLNWYDETRVKKNGLGSFTLSLEQGREERLHVSKHGFFDQDITIDYETVKASPHLEVRLQPRIPQLKLSVLSPGQKPLSTTVALHAITDSTEFFNEEISTFPFIIDLDFNQSMLLEVSAPGYLPMSDTLELTDVFYGRLLERTFKLTPLKVGHKMLTNTHFNGSQINDLSKRLLSGIVAAMKNNASMVLGVAVTGMADPSVLKLRAQTVIDFLAQSGIDRNRLQVRPGSRSNNDLVEFSIIKL